MIKFKCTSCGSVMRAALSDVGKKTKCPCGKVIPIPAPPQNAASENKPATPQTHAASAKIVQCPSCKTSLRVRAENLQKAVRCSCGHVFRSNGSGGTTAPTTQPVSPQPIPVAAIADPAPAAPATSLFDSIPTPPPSQPAYAPPPPTYQPPPPAPAPYRGAPADHAQAQKSAMANQYLANAHADAAAQRQRQSEMGPSDDDFFGGGFVGGLAMIAIGIIWLVGGLAAGYFFPYPVVMVFIGMGMMFKSFISSI